MRNATISAVTTVLSCSLAAVQLLGCAPEDSAAPGGGAAGAAAPTSFATTVQPLFDEACSCHQSTPMLMAPFSLKPGEAYGNLVGRPATQLPSMALVEPGALNESYLWHKVSGTQVEAGGSGMIMPYTVPLRADELRVIEQWIASGAAP